MSGKPRIVVVGAGVVGLTTALLLARSKKYDITLVSKHMPGDYSIEYTSPWAGASWWPVSTPNTPESAYERVGFFELWRLANHVPEAGIAVRDSFVYARNKDFGTPSSERGDGSVSEGSFFNDLVSDEPWFKDLAPEFRKLRRDELPKGVDRGTVFKSVCINTAIYLPWLVSQLLGLGVEVKRATVRHICEAAGLHRSGKKTDLVVNCTGLAAGKLGGVMDEKVYPVRGQVVVVRNQAPGMYVASGTDDDREDSMYIMERAAGGGTVLGGCYQIGRWESEPDPNLAQRIMKRCVEYCPQLVKPGQGVEGLDVIRHGVGLRPNRHGGPRVESETIDGVKVVHNYGAGSFGYQTSYGLAERTVRCTEESLKPRAKL